MEKKMKSMQDRMKRIYEYVYLFFTGSLFPFLVVEFYVQDSFTFGTVSMLSETNDESKDMFFKEVPYIKL